MTKPESPFVYAICQVGAEPALKKELALSHPELRFAYSRPGFVTFKRADGALLADDYELRAVFARASGLSFGKADGMASVLERARTLGGGTPLRLHLWERDRYVPGDEPPGFERGAAARKAEKALRQAAAAAGIPLHAERVAQTGELVFDVILTGDPEVESEWWLGCHRQTAGRSPYPGGLAPLELPPEAPSRAYLKLEEALAWGRVPVRAGDVAVEIGSAPGGASYALLRRGISVVGIDPAEMAPVVLGFRAGKDGASFRHLRLPVAQVTPELLPREAQWLLLDMNVAHSVSLFAVDRLATLLKDSLLGVLLTVKLNQWKMASEIPSMLKHVESMGFVRVRAAQLSHQRQEFLIYGLTRKGLLRR